MAYRKGIDKDFRVQDITSTSHSSTNLRKKNILQLKQLNNTRNFLTEISEAFKGCKSPIVEGFINNLNVK